MFNEALISNALAQIHFRRVRKLTYKRILEESEVEHLLFLTVYGVPKHFLNIDFGIRNTAAEIFGVESVRRYCGRLYADIQYEPNTTCAMLAPIGALFDWGPRSKLYLPNYSETGISDKIRRDVEQYIVPVLSRIKDCRDLLGVLTGNDEPFAWFRTNAAIRSAQIIFLGQRLGVPSSEIRAHLKTYQKLIARDVGGEMDWLSYINVVLKDAEVVNSNSDELQKDYGDSAL